MERRDSGLQQVIDLAETAVLASQNRDGEAHRAAGLVFDRLRQSVGSPATAEPAQLPVCEHLPAALAAGAAEDEAESLLASTGKVLRAGKRIIVTTAEVDHLDDQGKASPCAVMQQTLAPVPKTY